MVVQPPGVIRSILWIRAKLYWMKCRATAAAWFSTFLLNALVRRVKRRIDIRIVRFWRSTKLVLTCLGFPSGIAGGSRAYAEYVSVPASKLAHKSAATDHIHAAGAPMSLLNAWQYMIEVGHNEPNPLQPNSHEPVPLEG